MIWLGEHDWRPQSPGVIFPPPLPLAALRQYGVYPWPPERFANWVHPDDEVVAAELLPSDRVFRRLATDGPYIVLGYGAVRVRVLPALCRIISGDGMDIGDAVEVLSHGGRNNPLVGVIAEMRCPLRQSAIEYYLKRGERLLPAPFEARDLQPLPRWGAHE